MSMRRQHALTFVHQAGMRHALLLARETREVADQIHWGGEDDEVFDLAGIAAEETGADIYKACEFVFYLAARICKHRKYQ